MVFITIGGTTVLDDPAHLFDSLGVGDVAVAIVVGVVHGPHLAPHLEHCRNFPDTVE